MEAPSAQGDQISIVDISSESDTHSNEVRGNLLYDTKSNQSNRELPNVDQTKTPVTNTRGVDFESL